MQSNKFVLLLYTHDSGEVPVAPFNPNTVTSHNTPVIVLLLSMLPLVSGSPMLAATGEAGASDRVAPAGRTDCKKTRRSYSHPTAILHYLPSLHALLPGNFNGYVYRWKDSAKLPVICETTNRLCRCHNCEMLLGAVGNGTSHTLLVSAHSEVKAHACCNASNHQ
jgi:hypothetical protein